MSIKRVFETRKNRLRRRSGKILSDIVKSVSLVVAIGAVAFLMVFAYNVIITASLFKLSHVSVRGCEKVARDEVLRLADISPHCNILTVNLGAIARRVEKDSWIREASVGRELPDRLVIEVTERKPEALVLVDGKIHVVDGEGIVFKEYDRNDNISLPVINGLCDGGNINHVLMRKTLPLLHFLAMWGSFPTRDHVSEIHGDEVYGFSLYTQGGLCLQMGFGNYEDKLKRLKPVLRDLARRDLGKRCLRIDLTDFHKVVVMKKDAVTPGISGKGYNT